MRTISQAVRKKSSRWRVDMRRCLVVSALSAGQFFSPMLGWTGMFKLSSTKDFPNPAGKRRACFP